MTPFYPVLTRNMLRRSANDGARGAGSAIVAEIVTFRLSNGITPESFLDAVATSDAFLDTRSGFLSRRLTQNEDGTWTDYLEWTDMEAAKSAAEALMTTEGVQPFLSAVDPESVTMHHGHIRRKRAA